MFRLFRAIAQWFSNILTKLGLRAEAAADAQFTRDATSKAMAFDLHSEKLEQDYDTFASALSQAEVALQSKRDLLENIQKNKEDAQSALNGALAAYERAQTAGDQKGMADAQKDGIEFKNEVDRLADREVELTADIDKYENELEDLLEQLADIQKEIAALPAQKAQAIADHVSNEKLIEARIARSKMDDALNRLTAAH